MDVNPEHVAQRNDYIRNLLANRSKPHNERPLEVYTDESYVHHHHRIDHCSLYHPDGPESIGKAPRKGRRICFVVTICNQGTHMHAGSINRSVWHFLPKSAKDHKGDYHKVFNAEDYWN